MNSLIEQVMGSLSGAQVQQISSQIGASPAQTQNAIQAAVPLLLGALGRNASSPQGASALLGALTRDHAGGSGAGALLQGMLGGMLGAGQPQGRAGGNATLSAGEAILGHLLGGRQQRADQGVAAVSGLNAGQAHQLLAMLAPLVMSVLGRQVSQNRMDPSALAGMLGQEQQRAQQAAPGNLLSAVLDRDGDGKLDTKDLMQAGASVLGSLFGKR